MRAALQTPVLKALIDRVPTSDIDRLHIRAKTALQDQVADYFIVGSGGVKDYIADDPAQVSMHLQSAARKNTGLQLELQEHKANVDEDKNLPGLLVDLRDRAASVDLPGSLVSVDGVEAVP